MKNGGMVMRSKTLVMIGALAGALGSGMVMIGRAAGVSGIVQQDEKKSEKCTLKITGMTCAGCAAAVKMAAKKVDGVTAIDVSYKDGKADVTFDPGKTTPDAIAKAVTNGSGFKAEVQKPAEK